MAESGLYGPDNEVHDVFVLPERLTIALVAETFQGLMSHVEQGGDITLDGGAVERIDAAGVQLLVLVRHVAMEAQHTLCWVTVSDALRESANLLGLAEQLDLPAGQ